MGGITPLFDLVIYPMYGIPGVGYPVSGDPQL
jgi:hypothetical protein